MSVRDLLRPQNPLINDTSNPKTLGGPGDSTISGLLGGGLPEGSSVNIKIGGNQALKPKPTGAATTTPPPPGQAGALAPPTTTTPPTTQEGDTQLGPCPDGQEFVWGADPPCMDICAAGQVRDIFTHQCVQNPLDLEPWKACEEKGGKWVASDPLNPAIGNCDFQDAIKECIAKGREWVWQGEEKGCVNLAEGQPGYEECIASGGTWSLERKECIPKEDEYADKKAECEAKPDHVWSPAHNRCYPTSYIDQFYQQCVERGCVGFDISTWECTQCPPEIDPATCDPDTQHFDPVAKRCVDNIVDRDGEPPPPIDPPDDWGDYYSWLFGDDEFEEDMKYWNVQQGVIEGAFNEEWLETEAQLAASGYAYSTQRGFQGIFHQRALSESLSMAFQVVMKDALDRKLQRQKMALDFFLGDKALDIQQQLGQGELDIATLRLALEEQAMWNQMSEFYAQLGISQQQIELELFKAITERMVAEASIDQNWALVYANFLKLSIELGMSEEEAREFFDGLMDQYGHESNA